MKQNVPTRKAANFGRPSLMYACTPNTDLPPHRGRPEPLPVMSIHRGRFCRNLGQKNNGASSPSCPSKLPLSFLIVSGILQAVHGPACHAETIGVKEICRGLAISPPFSTHLPCLRAQVGVLFPAPLKEEEKVDLPLKVSFEIERGRTVASCIHLHVRF